MQLMTEYRRDPRHVEGMSFRYGYRAQHLREPEATEELHRADIGDVHLGVRGRRAIALDQHNVDAEARQHECERHANRSCTGDQDRNASH